jgi:hypothetical protein
MDGPVQIEQPERFPEHAERLRELELAFARFEPSIQAALGSYERRIGELGTKMDRLRETVEGHSGLVGLNLRVKAIETWQQNHREDQRESTKARTGLQNGLIVGIVLAILTSLANAAMYLWTALGKLGK